MKLLEAYSLGSGQKIDKIQIVDKFFPLSTDNYIVFQPFSKESKNYDYWQEVIDVLKQHLDAHNIAIVQIGAANERPLDGCYHAQGQTTVNQAAYIIKNAKLMLGCDSFGLHLAGHYNIPLVGLYSNNYAYNVCPYFGDKSKQVFIEPPRSPDERPCFSFVEQPKSINRIKPEAIISEVLKLLGIENTFNLETVYFGDFFSHPKIIEMVPDTAINIQNLGVDAMIVRMDYKFDEQILANQLMVGPVIIVTDRPINIQLLTQFKDRIKQIVYKINEDNSPAFALALQRLGLNFNLTTFLDDETLNKYKLDYLDISIIHRRTLNTEAFSAFDKSNLFFKMNKILLAGQKIYQNKAAWKANCAIPNLKNIFQPFIDIPEMYEDLDFACIAKLK